MSDKIPMPILPVLPGISLPQSQKTIPFPTSPNKATTKKIMPKSHQMKISVDETITITKTELPMLAKNNIEAELIELGYSIIDIMVSDKIKLLKTINKKGQKVYIYIDDMTDIVSNNKTMITETNVSILPYSVKTGAYNCVGVDVIGLVFEHSVNCICTIIRGDNDLKITETNYIKNHSNNHSNNHFEGCVIAYPMIKLSELKINPDFVLHNTDIVTRRLRNTEDSHERKELQETDCALEQLIEALCEFKSTCNNSTHKIIMNIQELKNDQECNENLRDSLIKSNDNIIKLICVMKKVAGNRKEMSKMTNDIKELTNYLNSEI